MSKNIIEKYAKREGLKYDEALTRITGLIREFKDLYGIGTPEVFDILDKDRKAAHTAFGSAFRDDPLLYQAFNSVYSKREGESVQDALLSAGNAGYIARPALHIKDFFTGSNSLDEHEESLLGPWGYFRDASGNWQEPGTEKQSQKKDTEELDGATYKTDDDLAEEAEEAKEAKEAEKAEAAEKAKKDQLTSSVTPDDFGPGATSPATLDEPAPSLSEKLDHRNRQAPDLRRKSRTGNNTFVDRSSFRADALRRKQADREDDLAERKHKREMRDANRNESLAQLWDDTAHNRDDNRRWHELSEAERRTARDHYIKRSSGDPEYIKKDREAYEASLENPAPKVTTGEIGGKGKKTFTPAPETHTVPGAALDDIPSQEEMAVRPSPPGTPAGTPYAEPAPQPPQPSYAVTEHLNQPPITQESLAHKPVPPSYTEIPNQPSVTQGSLDHKPVPGSSSPLPDTPIEPFGPGISSEDRERQFILDTAATVNADEGLTPEDRERQFILDTAETVGPGLPTKPIPTIEAGTPVPTRVDDRGLEVVTESAKVVPSQKSLDNPGPTVGHLFPQGVGSERERITDPTFADRVPIVSSVNGKPRITGWKTKGLMARQMGGAKSQRLNPDGSPYVAPGDPMNFHGPNPNGDPNRFAGETRGWTGGQKPVRVPTIEENARKRVMASGVAPKRPMTPRQPYPSREEWLNNNRQVPDEYLSPARLEQRRRLS